MSDPYQTLGVERGASDKAIRAAYRKLAKLHHPDLNPGKTEAEEKFKAISTAYALLSDPEKRGRFDRGEIDETGAERPPQRPFYRDFADQPGHARYGGGFDASSFDTSNMDPDELEALLGQMFGQGRRGGPARGADAHYMLTVDFLDAANGAVRRLNLPDGRVLDVTIPAGHRDGQALRLKGQGAPGREGGPAGDAIIEIAVAPHKFFRRDGQDILLQLPVTVQEAVLGAKVPVPTITGKVNLTIPPNSSTGTRLMLRGRGIKGGHQYVTLSVMAPPQTEPELAEFLKNWKPRHEFNPREGLA
jgi:DnaJ-class molecular chaperone